MSAIITEYPPFFTAIHPLFFTLPVSTTGDSWHTCGIKLQTACWWAGAANPSPQHLQRQKWKKDVRIMLEEDGFGDGKTFRYISGRQKNIYTIPRVDTAISE